MATPIWEPTLERVEAAQVTHFCAFLADRTGRAIPDTDALSAWALKDSPAFWDAVWDWADVAGHKGATWVDAGSGMETARFFPEARLNFAENILKGASYVTPDSIALVSQAEDVIGTRWTWQDLSDHVSQLQQAFRAAAVVPGDRIAAILPNGPEAIACMLAATSLGAIWSSASPDFGAQAIVERFGQIEPKLMIMADGYRYAGKRIPLLERLSEILAGLPSVTKTVIVDNIGEADRCCAALPLSISYAELTGAFVPAAPDFVALPFDHPIFILFSSGTTGAPKCIVHRAGGVLLQHLKELALHADVRPADRLFYYTTLGWMMWNWMVSGLSRGATLVLYDGSPFHPTADVLWQMAEREGVTHFGTSAKYIDTMRIKDARPGNRFALAPLRTVLSTGSPLLPANFEYVYSIKPDLHLASISGGTDIVSCFVCGDPTQPVFAGELQRPGFGLDVQIWADDGTPAAPGEQGELVCAAPFPCMPLGFWKDDGTRYRSTYFLRFPGIWCQGDFAEKTKNGGIVIHGRSDTTLNPGGVRIGTAEIYAEVSRFHEVIDCVAVGQETDGDQRVLLFVQLADGQSLSSDLVARIKSQLRRSRSPRHVPSEIHQAPALPRTRSGKISETAVRDAVNGKLTANMSGLENPEAINHFARFHRA